MRLSLFISALAVSIHVSPAAAGELAYVPNSTKRVCQLTGDVDRTTGQPTLSSTNKHFGVLATDLGSSFEHDGKLCFLFGDTWGRPGDRDVMAWTKSANPDKIVLDFHKDKDGKWLPLTVPGIKQGAFEIPSGGISVGGVIYAETERWAYGILGKGKIAEIGTVSSPEFPRPERSRSGRRAVARIPDT